MLAAAAICPAAPLLARELTGTDPVVPELRRASMDAVAALVASVPELIAIVGVADANGRWGSGGGLDVGAFAPALRYAPGLAPGAILPPSLGLGSMLLDSSEYDGPREFYSVTEDDPVADCAALGTQLAQRPERVALLVMADGSATRTLKAPGYLDVRSEPFDAEIVAAIKDGDAASLLAADPDLARELMATGRPGWQVLAGAAASSWSGTQLRYCDDPFGVLYLVASVTCDPLVALRPVADADLESIFEQQRDPESVLMAAFTTDDPSDRAAFDAHMARIRSDAGIVHRAVTCNGLLVGTIAAFVVDGDTEVTYWIDRAWWGRGIASRALALLLGEVTTRPLHARVASDNAASLRVLRKSGFAVVGTEVSYASARGDEIEETILRKDR
jgi:RimJ/RimL family protein N-acetyltransferase